MPSSKMKLLAQIIGQELVEKLIQEYSGKEVFIPKKEGSIRPNGRIAQIIGVAATKKIVAVWGGQSLYIPKKHDKKRNLIFILFRNKLILDLHAYGLDPTEIARVLDMKKRRIVAVLKNPQRWESPQKNLVCIAQKNLQKALLRQQIVQGLQNGKSKRALGKEIGISRSYIYKLLSQESGDINT